MAKKRNRGNAPGKVPANIEGNDVREQMDNSRDETDLQAEERAKIQILAKIDKDKKARNDEPQEKVDRVMKLRRHADALQKSLPSSRNITDDDLKKWIDEVNLMCIHFSKLAVEFLSDLEELKTKYVQAGREINTFFDELDDIEKNVTQKIGVFDYSLIEPKVKNTTTFLNELKSERSNLEKKVKKKCREYPGDESLNHLIMTIGGMVSGKSPQQIQMELWNERLEAVTQERNAAEAEKALRDLELRWAESVAAGAQKDVGLAEEQRNYWREFCSECQKGGKVNLKEKLDDLKRERAVWKEGLEARRKKWEETMQENLQKVAAEEQKVEALAAKEAVDERDIFVFLVEVEKSSAQHSGDSGGTNGSPVLKELLTEVASRRSAEAGKSDTVVFIEYSLREDGLYIGKTRGTWVTFEDLSDLSLEASRSDLTPGFAGALEEARREIDGVVLQSRTQDAKWRTFMFFVPCTSMLWLTRMSRRIPPEVAALQKTARKHGTFHLWLWPTLEAASTDMTPYWGTICSGANAGTLTIGGRPMVKATNTAPTDMFSGIVDALTTSSGGSAQIEETNRRLQIFQDRGIKTAERLTASMQRFGDMFEAMLVAGTDAQGLNKVYTNLTEEVESCLAEAEQEVQNRQNFHHDAERRVVDGKKLIQDSEDRIKAKNSVIEVVQGERDMGGGKYQIPSIVGIRDIGELYSKLTSFKECTQDAVFMAQPLYMLGMLSQPIFQRFNDLQKGVQKDVWFQLMARFVLMGFKKKGVVVDPDRLSIGENWRILAKWLCRNMKGVGEENVERFCQILDFNEFIFTSPFAQDLAGHTAKLAEKRKALEETLKEEVGYDDEFLQMAQRVEEAEGPALGRAERDLERAVERKYGILWRKILPGIQTDIAAECMDVFIAQGFTAFHSNIGQLKDLFKNHADPYIQRLAIATR